VTTEPDPTGVADAEQQGVGDRAMGPDPVVTVTDGAARRPPRRLRAFVIGVVLAVALAVFLFVGLGTTSNSGKGTGGVVPVGAAAPDFTLPSVVGGPVVDLAALGVHLHHPVILNFFASWCVPCQAETPLLASTAAAEQAKGSVIQFVGVDAADQPSDAVPFIHRSGITYPVAQDAVLQVTAGLYGLNAEPNTFFINESGVVVGHHQGALDKALLDSWIHRLAGGG
jgi:cytochrome c biogenesis protein CcmG/thiol:disulfide interchange protein DsbE